MSRRKVAVVAKAPTAALAPFSDPSWEIWGLVQIKYPRVDRLFDPHGMGCWYDERQGFANQCNTLGVPVWCEPSVRHLYRNGRDYPLDEIVADIGRCFLESSISYMLAMAIWERVDRIGIWGVHLTTKDEYLHQRASAAWLIGLAEGRGIEVDICPGAPLFASRYVSGRYGVDREKRF